MLTEEQKAKRLDYICGSDAAVICGLSPFKTPLQLWMEKTRRVFEDDISHFNHIKFGNFMEDGVARWFEAETGKKVLPAPTDMLIHPKYPWMAGNIDRLIDGENAILECKTALVREGWGDEADHIPANYLLQVAHYCAVGGYDRAYIAVVFAMTREMRVYKYERDQKLESRLIAREEEFYNKYILADEPPDIKTPDDVLLKFDKTSLVAKPVNDNLYEKYREYLHNVKQIKELEKHCEDIKIAIKLYLQDAPVLTDFSGSQIATWKYTKPIQVFDKKQLQKDNPELYARYVREDKPQRRLTIHGEE